MRTSKCTKRDGDADDIGVIYSVLITMCFLVSSFVWLLSLSLVFNSTEFDILAMLDGQCQMVVLVGWQGFTAIGMFLYLENI